MAVTRTSPNSDVIDILDRVLDKGIVIDAWMRVSLAGINLVEVEARVVVASIETYANTVDTITHLPPLQWGGAPATTVDVPRAKTIAVDRSTAKDSRRNNARGYRPSRPSLR